MLALTHGGGSDDGDEGETKSLKIKNNQKLFTFSGTCILTQSKHSGWLGK